MAGSFTDYAEAKILNYICKGTAFSTPSPLYLALTTSVPDDTSTGATLAEATYTGYARKEIAAGDWTTATAGAIENANEIEFADCTGGTSTIIGFALCDSAGTGTGNVIAWGDCSSTVISATQTPATFAAGALDITLS